MRARQLLAAVAASATTVALLAGCSGGDDEEGVSTAEEIVDGAHPADDNADPDKDPRIGTNTDLAAQLITAEDLADFDANAKTAELDSDTIVQYVEGREAIKNSSGIFGGACDSALDTDTVVDSLLDDGVIERVSFPEGEGEDPQNSGAGAITVALKQGRLDGFLDRANYTGCQGAQAPSTEVPGVEAGAQPFTVTLGITLQDLTGVEGVEGFREVRDIVRSNDAGETVLGRNIIIHAFAGDTTMEISYTANSEDINANPITDLDNQRLAAIIAAQSDKLENA